MLVLTVLLPYLASGAVVLDSTVGRLDVSRKVAIFRDPGGRLALDEVRSPALASSFVVPGDRVSNIGFTQDVIWGRIEIENGGADPMAAVLELPVARLREVTWFVLDGDAVVSILRDGLDVVPSRETLPQLRYPVLDFVLPAGAVRTVYLRIRADRSLSVPLNVFSFRGYLRYAAQRDVVDYAFASISGTLFILFLLLAGMQRSRSYLLLAVMIAGLFGYTFIFRGYYAWLGGVPHRWANHNLMLALVSMWHWALLAFTLTCTRSTFSKKKVYSFLRGVSLFLLAGAMVSCVIPYRAAAALHAVLLFVCYVCGGGAALRLSYSSRDWSHWLIAMTWGVAWLVTFLLFAAAFAWFRVPIDVDSLQLVFMLFMFFMLFAVVVLQQRSARQNQVRIQRAELLATDAQLRALRYQLNPHFLFNTLATIESLSHFSPERIASLVHNLSVFLRLRIDPSPEGGHAFGKEWDSVRAYLEIEQVRYGESLHVRHSVSDEVLHCRVPEMLLQPLAENAIKHGMLTEGRLDISFCAHRLGRQLHVHVENNGVLSSDSDSPDGGVGMRNLRERLQLLYGESARFDLRQEGPLVVAELFIPFEVSAV